MQHAQIIMLFNKQIQFFLSYATKQIDYGKAGHIFNDFDDEFSYSFSKGEKKGYKNYMQEVLFPLSF